MRGWSSRRQAVAAHDIASFRSPARARWRSACSSPAGAAPARGRSPGARHLDPRDRGLLPTGTTGVVVLDLSLSILDDQSGVVRRTLQSLVDSDARVGLVDLLRLAVRAPAAGHAREGAEAVIRLLTPGRDGKVVSPWTEAFRSGTRISTALQLAHDMLVGDRVKDGSILLVSDLETAPDDVPTRLASCAGSSASGTPVRLLALGPSSDARTLFGGILGREAFSR